MLTNFKIISIANLKAFFVKTKKNQFLKHVQTHKNAQTKKKLNYDFEFVFFDKYVELKKIDNLFVMTASNKKTKLNSNINKH